MKAKILLVDDEAAILETVGGALSERYDCDCAQSGGDALNFIQAKGPYAVVIADRTMPGMGGVELLESISKSSPETSRVMLTGDSDQAAAIEAVNRGKVFYFLSKPCTAKLLFEVVESAVNHHRMNSAQKDVAESTVASSVKLLTDVLGTVSAEALGRGERLRAAMKVFAQHLGISPSERLPMAALLSPLGYASVPTTILRKVSTGGALLPQEEALLKRIPQYGHDLIKSLPALQPVARAVLYQNKHYDGHGFPDDALAGEEIPVGARMLKILGDRLDLENDGVVKQRAQTAMAARTGYYDPWRLGKCFEAMPEFLPNLISKDKEVLSASAKDLAAGQILVSSVTSRSGFQLLAAGDRLTDITVTRLKDAIALGDVEEPILVQDSD